MITNKLKTLVIISPGFPENEADSTCIPPQQIFVKALKEANPALNIIVLTYQYPFYSGEYQWHGIRVISFGHAKQSRWVNLFTGPRVWAALSKINKDYQIIGLLSFWFGKCSYVAHLFAKKHFLKHYSWILGQDAKAGNKYFNKIKPSGESLIALSDFIVAEFHKNYGVRPQHIIPVGIDTALFGTAPRQRNIDILGAGNLIPLKQYHVFLEVVSLLKETIPGIQAVICGDGPEMKRLQERVRDLALENNVILKGRMTHSEVLSLMQQSKTFLHSSNYEGFGAVCLEALYAGAQVVSFVRPMKAEIKNWHIATDTADMLLKLMEILSGPAGSDQPVLPYTIQANVRKMMQLLE